MIAHLEDRAAALTAFGWTRREAEWLALVCLHSGVFFRSQHLAFIGRTNRALANRFIRRCRKVAVEQPWNGSRLRLCRNASRRLYRTLGAEHVRHRRAATPEVLLRRLLSLDYVLEHPHAPWLPTEDEKVNALVAAEIPKDVLPRRLYHGAVSAQVRYLPHKLPLALDAARATFVFVQAEDETESAVRTWGAQHAKLWARLAEAGRAVEVVVVGRDPDRLGAAGRMLDKWASKLAAAEAKPEAEAEMAAIRRAIAACDMTGPAGLRRHQRRPEAHGRSGHRRDRPAGGRGGTDLALGAGAAVPRGYAGRRPIGANLFSQRGRRILACGCMTRRAGTVDEDWDVLLSFLPQDWRELAQDTGALKGLRKDKTVDNLLRTLLLHLGCGHSLRETVVRARQAHLADLSDVALLKRLKKSKGWLHALCVRLFEEQGLAVIPGGAFQVRAVDATTVKEPGPSGSLWRVHYSVGLPSLACDFFKLTGTEGPGTGESLAQFPIRAGDHVLADRGYSTARGIRHVVDAGGRLIVRVNTGSLPLCTAAGRPFDLLAAVSSVTRPAAGRSWATTVAAPGDDGGPAGEIAGRVCVLRKSAEAIRLAHQKVRRDAARKGNQVQPATLRFAEYVIVFTTFPEPSFSAADVLEWYRLRWQVELVFKRFKSLAQLGHVPKYDDDSAKAWLYGKLFVALLVEKLIHHARAISPWGYDMPPPAPPQRVA